MPTPRNTPAPGLVLLAVVFDVVLVIAFAATGRASHDEAAFGPGLVTTAWPFLAALAVGWILSLGWRHPLAAIRTGLPIWAVTLVGGMLARLASGQGVQPAFVVVAAIVLAVTLIGWRGIAALVRRLRARRSAA